MEVFTLISQHWVEPFAYAALGIFVVKLLYPLLKEELPSIAKALREARTLPQTIEGLNAAVGRLSEAQTGLNQFARELNESLDNIQDKIEQASRKISDLEKLTEDRSAVGEQERGDTNDWQQSRNLWLGVKDYIEQKIDGIRDGRTRRRYSSESRYDYTSIAEKMVRDELLNQQQSEALIQMNAEFRSIRNRRLTVDRDYVRRFQNWRDTIAG